MDGDCSCRQVTRSQRPQLCLQALLQALEKRVQQLKLTEMPSCKDGLDSQNNKHYHSGMPLIDRSKCNQQIGIRNRSLMGLITQASKGKKRDSDPPPTSAPIKATTCVIPTMSTPNGVAHSFPICEALPSSSSCSRALSSSSRTCCVWDLGFSCRYQTGTRSLASRTAVWV